jgi:hypothetical protein
MCPLTFPSFKHAETSEFWEGKNGNLRPPRPGTAATDGHLFVASIYRPICQPTRPGACVVFLPSLLRVFLHSETNCHSRRLTSFPLNQLRRGSPPQHNKQNFHNRRHLSTCCADAVFQEKLSEFATICRFSGKREMKTAVDFFPIWPKRVPDKWR